MRLVALMAVHSLQEYRFTEDLTAGDAEKRKVVSGRARKDQCKAHREKPVSILTVNIHIDANTEKMKITITT